MTATATHDITNMTADAFAERVFTSSIATFELMSIYLGDRLGWYRALAEDGPATARELTDRAGGHERYAREWLEQQATAGILATDDTTGGERRFRLPSAAAEVLTDELSLSYLGPLPRMFGAFTAQLSALLDAYRTGGGVSWAKLGPDARESQADINRPWFEQALAGALAGVEEVDAVLRRPGARIADIGCGAGWSSIALASAYPDATVDGFDVDDPSVELARRNAVGARIDDRVRFHSVDAQELSGEGGYDAVFAFECLHDMPQPVEVLASARRSVKPDGVVVIMDEAVAERFAPPGDDLERWMYGFSLFVCLPDAMAHEPTAATGTVMRPDTLRGYARQAGFAGIDVLPISDFGFWRFYSLRL